MGVLIFHPPVGSVFKIEVFNALQNIPPYLKTSLQNATQNWKWRRHLKSSIEYARHENQQV